MKITTRFGYEFDENLDSKVQIIDSDGELKFKQLRDLRVGDYVCIQRGQQDWRKKEVDLTGFEFERKEMDMQSRVHQLPETVTKEFARFLGYLVSEGCMTGDGHINFANTDEEVLKDYESCVKNVFNYDLDSQIIPRTENHKRGTYFDISSVYIKQFLNYCGLNNVKSNEKVIPWVVLQSPKEIVAEYLKAYFEGDGCVGDYEIGVTTASEKMSKQLQVVLSNFGIICSRKIDLVCLPGKTVKRPYYDLSIYGNNINIFRREVDFVSKRKRKKLDTVCSRKRIKSDTDVIPYASKKFAKIYCRLSSDSRPWHCKGSQIYGKSWKYLCLCFHGTVQNVTYPQLEKHEMLHNLVDSNILKHRFFFDPIKVVQEDNKGRI